MRNFKWLSPKQNIVLIQLLYQFEARLASGFNICHQNFLHSAAIWQTRMLHFSFSQEVRRKKNLECVVTVYQVLLVFVGRLPLLAQFHGKATQSKIGTWRRPFSFTPRPIHRQVKIALKPRTNRKRKKWLRPIFHEVQFFIIAPHSISGQQEMVERTRVALIPFPFTLCVWEEQGRTESANE
jgi:hypothetical protein